MRKKEEYFAEVEQGILDIQVPNSEQAFFTIPKLFKGFSSDNPNLFLGRQEANCASRALWFCDGVEVKLSEKISAVVPHCLFEPHSTIKILEKLTEWGFNTLVFGAFSQVNESKIEANFSQIYQAFHRFGVRLVYRPKLQKKPGEDGFIEDLENFCHFVGDLDGIYWRSEINNPDYNEYPYTNTYQDLLLEEHRQLKEAVAHVLPDPLLYYEIPYSPKGNSISLLEIQKELPIDTHLVFSPFKGDAYEDHAPYQSLWNELKQQKHPSATPIAPIINAGGINQGEGLWPSLPLDLLTFLSQQTLTSAVVVTHALPAATGLLEASLWITGQMLWHGNSPTDWFRIWAKSSHWNSSEDLTIPFLTSMRRLCLLLSEIKSILKKESKVKTDVWRLRVEGFLAELNYWDKQALPAQWKSLLFPFARDARRLIFFALQQWNIPMGNVLGGEDIKEGFWTDISEVSTQGFGGAAKITLREFPRMNVIDESLKSILEVNRELV